MNLHQNQVGAHKAARPSFEIDSSHGATAAENNTLLNSYLAWDGSWVDNYYADESAWRNFNFEP